MRRFAAYFTVVIVLCMHPCVYAQFFDFQGQKEDLRVGDQLVINHFNSDPDVYENHLVITDVEGAGPVVNVLLYDQSGELLDQHYYFLPLFGKVNYNPADRIGNKVFTGWIQILSDGGRVAAQYWQWYKDPAKSGWNSAIPAADGEGSTALLVQHFVADPGLKAKLVLVNQSSDTSALVAVTFYLDRGKQLTRDKHLIPASGSVVLDPYAENEGLIRTGVAFCEVLEGGKITGEYWQASPTGGYQISLPLEIVPERDRDW